MNKSYAFSLRVKIYQSILLSLVCAGCQYAEYNNPRRLVDLRELNGLEVAEVSYGEIPQKTEEDLKKFFVKALPKLDVQGVVVNNEFYRATMIQQELWDGVGVRKFGWAAKVDVKWAACVGYPFGGNGKEIRIIRTHIFITPDGAIHIAGIVPDEVVLQEVAP